MLFEQVADALGPAAVIETFNGGTLKVLFRREGDLVVPWPLLKLNLKEHGRSDEDAWMRPKHEGDPPRISGLGRGCIDIHDGPDNIGVAYDDDGRCFETVGCRPDGFPGAEAALSRKSAHPVELLAAFVASLDVGRHGPGRLFAPALFPQGLDALWVHGRGFLRDALFHDRIPPGAAFAVADALTGDALGCGASMEAALTAWRAEVERVRPWMAKAEPQAPVEIPEGFGALSGPEPGVPMPARSPANTPAVLVPVAAIPAAPPPVGAWKRVLGICGAPSLAALRPDAGGFTMFGDRAVAEIHAIRLEKRLGQVDDAEELLRLETGGPPGWHEAMPPMACKVRYYRLLDETTGRRIEPMAGGEQNLTGFDPGNLDGDRLRWGAMRLRWEE